jgi:hypothetical protein
VYTHLSNRGGLLSRKRFGVGKTWARREDESQELVGCFGDTDAGSDLDPPRAKAIFADPQAGGGRGEVESVVSRAGDGEGLGEAPGAAGKSRAMAGAGQRDSAGARHFFKTEEGFESAEKNRSRFAFAFTGDVEAIVIAVDKVNVGKAGRTEEDRIASCVAGGGVGGGIVGSEVSLDFDDAGCEPNLSATNLSVTNQNFAEKIARDASRTTSKETAIQGEDSGWSGGAYLHVHGGEILN